MSEKVLAPAQFNTLEQIDEHLNRLRRKLTIAPYGHCDTEVARIAILSEIDEWLDKRLECQQLQEQNR